MTTKVILYSGGMDSFAAWKLLQKERPGWERAYVKIDSRYTRKEMSRLDTGTIVIDALDLSTIEQEDGFIPQRNPLMVTLTQAELDADEIALCGVRGEHSRDKHPQFYRRMSKLLSYTAGKPVRVFSPFEKRTKSQAVGDYLKAGLDRDELLATLSCYHPTLVACGQCQSCFRRWVALENNGLAQYQFWGAYGADPAPKPWNMHFAPASTLRKLPVSMYYDFTLAQRDVALAYYRLWWRTGATRSKL